VGRDEGERDGRGDEENRQDTRDEPAASERLKPPEAKIRHEILPDAAAAPAWPAGGE
jgi:hypothetical protein